MYKGSKRTCTAIVLLIKPFVLWRSRCRCCHGLLKLPIDITGLTLLHLIEYTGKKAAKQFNVEDMFEKAKRTAKEISSSRMKESSDDYINDDDEPEPFVIMPPTSSNTEKSGGNKNAGDNSDDDDADADDDDDDGEDQEVILALLICNLYHTVYIQ